jgi:putative membrane protein
MDRKGNSYQLGLVAACAALLAVSLIRSNYPHEQWLQHPPTVVALAALLWAARRQWFSNAAMTCLVAFIALHIVGARWIYSYVPYERWFDAAVGSGPREWFGWTRNHYDRLVHVAFGALLVPPLVEIAVRFGRLRFSGAIVFALLMIATVSAVYEVFEWLLAIIVAPEYAEAYNGQQGDLWDAQKDIALALGGGIAGALWMMARGACTSDYPLPSPPLKGEGAGES